MTNKNKPRKTTELCTTTDNFVVMGNSLLRGKSALSSQMAKLLRLTIMQVKIDDDEIGAYHIKAKELSELMNYDNTNYSRDIQKLCYDLAEKTVKIKTHNPKKPWKVYPWIGYIEYTEDAEVIIQLNTWLAPHLLRLKNSGQYTQYILDCILRMKSIFSIRIYELLKMKLPNEAIPYGGIKVRLSNQELREATETENKLKQNTHFREKILDVAIREISEKTDFKVTYEQKKIHKGSYDTVEFLCKALWDDGKEIPINIQCKAKLAKMNSLRAKQGKKSLGMYDEIAGQEKFESVEEFDLYLMDYIADKAD
jgi:plasmid replication initiation protein